MDKENFYLHLGQQFRAARKRKSLRQIDVAELVGTTQAHYSHIENGTCEVRLNLAIELCKALDLKSLTNYDCNNS